MNIVVYVTVLVKALRLSGVALRLPWQGSQADLVALRLVSRLW
jgi:hypothetical protein